MLWLGWVGCTADVELPAPTGPFAIGRTTRATIDTERDEVLTPEEDHREVTVHVWYPADPGTDDVGAEYVPRLDELRPALDHQATRLFRHVAPHAIADAPVTDSLDLLPVVILSHGNDRLGAETGALAEDLASHGYAVAAIDHPYDARAALVGGEAVAFAEEAWPALPPAPADGQPDPDSDHAQFYRARVDVRTADATFVLDELAAEDPLGALGGSTALDLDRVAFVGHSVGGVTAGTFCREDLRADACVNLDGDHGGGPFYLTDDGAAFDPAFMMITKPFDVTDAQLADWGLTRDAWMETLAEQRDATFGQVTGGSFRVVLDGATHESFTDEPYVVALLEGDDASAAEEHIATTRAYVRAFLDRYLDGGPSTLLDEEPPPGVMVEQWPPH